MRIPAAPVMFRMIILPPRKSDSIHIQFRMRFEESPPCAVTGKARTLTIKIDRGIAIVKRTPAGANFVNIHCFTSIKKAPGSPGPLFHFI